MDICCLHLAFVCVSSSPLTGTPVMGFRVTLIPCDLILTNYIYTDSISKEGHILSLWGDMHFGGDTT